MLFGIPVEIIIASGIAVLVKLKADKSITWFGAAISIIVGLGCGIILYEPVMVLLGLPASWAVPVAVLSALTGENVMKSLLQISTDSEWIKDILRKWIGK